MSNFVYRFIAGPGGAPLPGSNDMEEWARIHRLKAAKHRKMWKNHIIRCLGRMPKFKRIFIDFLWVEPNWRRDPDNITGAKKLIFDCLKDVKCIPNDGHKQIAGWKHNFQVDRNNRDNRVGVWIMIRESE